MTTAEKRVVISRDAGELAASVGARFLDRVGKWAASGRTVHVGLTGGGISGEILDRIGAAPERESIDWSRVHFWWVDERFVPRSDDERNDEPVERDVELVHELVEPLVHEADLDLPVAQRLEDVVYLEGGLADDVREGAGLLARSDQAFDL